MSCQERNAGSLYEGTVKDGERELSERAKFRLKVFDHYYRESPRFSATKKPDAAPAYQYFGNTDCISASRKGNTICSGTYRKHRTGFGQGGKPGKPVLKAATKRRTKCAKAAGKAREQMGKL